MNRTLGYWFERLLGYAIGIFLTIFAYKYYSSCDFIFNSSFLDKVISICSTLFGFLLAILTLLLQGNSPTVNAMKLHGSYNRLINFNKITVLSAILTCTLSLIITFASPVIITLSEDIFKILVVLNFGMFGFVLINTVIFTLIFYKIVIADQ